MNPKLRPQAPNPALRLFILSRRGAWPSWGAMASTRPWVVRGDRQCHQGHPTPHTGLGLSREGRRGLRLGNALLHPGATIRLLHRQHLTPASQGPAALELAWGAEVLSLLSVQHMSPWAQGWLQNPRIHLGLRNIEVKFRAAQFCGFQYMQCPHPPVGLGRRTATVCSVCALALPSLGALCTLLCPFPCVSHLCASPRMRCGSLEIQPTFPRTLPADPSTGGR